MQFDLDFKQNFARLYFETGDAFKAALQLLPEKDQLGTALKAAQLLPDDQEVKIAKQKLHDKLLSGSNFLSKEALLADLWDKMQGVRIEGTNARYPITPDDYSKIAKVYAQVLESVNEERKDEFPTFFAKKLAKSCGLYETHEEAECLREFQKLATCNEYDICKFVYMDFDLNEEQERILKVICDNTAIWLRGEIASNTLSIIKQSKEDVKGMTELFLENFAKGEQGSTFKKGVFVQLSGVSESDIADFNNDVIESYD